MSAEAMNDNPQNPQDAGPYIETQHSSHFKKTNNSE